MTSHTPAIIITYQPMLALWLQNIERSNYHINNLIYLLKSKDAEDTKLIAEFYHCDSFITVSQNQYQELLTYIKTYNILDLSLEYNYGKYEYIMLNNKWRMLLRNSVVHGHDFNNWHLKENFT